MNGTDWRSLGAGTMLAAVLGVWSGAAAAASFAAAFGAASLPQAAMLFFARRRPPQSAYSLWAGKFCGTILLLVLGARLLHSGGIFAAEFFIAGAAAGLALNIAHLAKRAAA